MSRFVCSCIFLAGVVMLALAVGIVLNGRSAGDRSIPEMRLAVQSAVASLEPCETCHSGARSDGGTLVAFRPLVQTSRPAVDAVPLAASMPQVDHLRVELDNRLVEVGRRILETPETGDPHYQAAMDGYLKVYDAARSDLDHDQAVSALHALDGVAALLAEVANQAHPVKATRIPEPAPRCMEAAMQTVSPPLMRVADRAQGVSLDQAPALVWSVSTGPVYVPSRVAVVSHRCDPPAGASVDSVGFA